MALQINRLKSQVRNVLIPNSLTHSGGTITAIFGGKIYQVVLSGLTANTRYQLYIVPNGTLLYSTAENSVGPAGYTSWFLIGSFYSNGMSSVAFGSFIPDLFSGIVTNPIPFDPAVSSFGAIGNAIFRWTRNAARARVEFSFVAGAPAGTTALVAAPFTAAASVGRILAGKWNGDATIVEGALVFDVSDKNNFRFSNDGGNWGVYLTGSGIGTSSFIGSFADYEVSGWNNTPVAYL